MGQDSLILKGKVVGNYQGKIYLRLMDGKHLIDVENGKFEFHTQLEQPILSGFTTSGEKFYIMSKPLFLENRIIELDLLAQFDEATNTLTLTPEKVKNAPLHEKFSKFNGRMNEIAKANPDKELRAQKSRNEIARLLDSDEPPSFKAAVLGLRKNFFHPDSLDKLSAKLPSGTNPLIPQDNVAKKDVVGLKLVDFAIADTTGEKINLSSLKGRYVLIDFWASWCKPCRLENRKLKVLYNERASQGLEIVSVSLDSNQKNWIKAIRQDSLPWIQLSDLQGYESTIAKHYQIGTIPDNLLVDKDGKIIARGITSEQLEKILIQNSKN